MRENAFVEAWKTQHRRVSMILGLTLLCAPSAISVYAENGVNDITVQAVMQTKIWKLAHIRMDFRGIMQSAWTRKG